MRMGMTKVKNRMNYRKLVFKIAWLCVLVVVAMAYNNLLNFQQTLTGSNRGDGILGVLMGLYICSQPAANILEAILFGRLTNTYEPSTFSAITWWGLNALVMFTGWIVIIVGMTRFAIK